MPTDRETMLPSTVRFHKHRISAAPGMRTTSPIESVFASSPFAIPGTLASGREVRYRPRPIQADGETIGIVVVSVLATKAVLFPPIQVDHRRLENLAAVARSKSVAEGDRRCQIPRRHRGH